MQRVILHLDLDAFYCAVEEKYDPSLVGKAFAVGGAADQRGVVASCSYPARMFGVRSAMPMARALRLCTDLLVISRRDEAYSHYSRQVMNILHDTTPLVEPLSIDEAFLDVTGIQAEPQQIARQLQNRITDEIGLPASIGVATNKLLAKTANNIGKARERSPQPPCSIEVVHPGQEADYLATLPIRELWGVGPKTAENLMALNIHTIGNIAAQTQQFMLHHFGKQGYDLWRRAQGIDNRPVEPERETKSISKETTFTQDVNDEAELKHVLRQLAEGVGRRLRQSHLAGTTVQIKLRWSDFTTITRQTTLAQPTQDNAQITEVALHLFEQHWPKKRPVRLIGVGISNFDDPKRQLELWETDTTKRNRKLQGTLDELRERFGDKTVQRGVDLKRRHD